MPLRPWDAWRRAHALWNKFCDEQVMNYVSMHGWHRMVGIIARKVEGGEFERLMEHIRCRTSASVAHGALGLQRGRPRPRHREDPLRGGQVEQQLAQSAWIAGDDYTLADINFYSLLRHVGGAHVPGDGDRPALPRLIAWREKMTARPAVARALAGEDRTAPGLRTWTGHAR